MTADRDELKALLVDAIVAADPEGWFSGDIGDVADAILAAGWRPPEPVAAEAVHPADAGWVRVCAACGGFNGEHTYSNCVYAPGSWRRP